MHDAAMKSFGIALLSLGVLAQAAQLPFDYIRPTVSESSPNFIGEDSFTALLHPDFADHSVRVKRTSGWCEEKEAVRSFTGYIDSGKLGSLHRPRDGAEAPMRLAQALIAVLLQGPAPYFSTTLTRGGTPQRTISSCGPMEA